MKKNEDVCYWLMTIVFCFLATTTPRQLRYETLGKKNTKIEKEFMTIHARSVTLAFRNKERDCSRLLLSTMRIGVVHGHQVVGHVLRRLPAETRQVLNVGGRVRKPREDGNHALVPVVRRGLPLPTAQINLRRSKTM